MVVQLKPWPLFIGQRSKPYSLKHVFIGDGRGCLQAGYLPFTLRCLFYLHSVAGRVQRIREPDSANPSADRDVVRYIRARPGLETVGYWTTFLAGAKPYLFPVPHSSPSSDDDRFQDVHESISLPVESLASVLGFCKRNGIPRSVFVHIARVLVLRYFTRQDEVSLDTWLPGETLRLRE